jgi:signal transduction histidine kinase/PAS domain-containing protein
MRFNTAVALFFASLSLILRTLDKKSRSRTILNRLGLIFAYIPLLVGLVTLFEYGTHFQIDVDQLLFVDKEMPMGFPGRPSPDTSLNLVLAGLALLIMNRNEPWARQSTQLTSLLLLALPLISLVSGLFGADQSFSILLPKATAVGAATNTALSFVLLSFALFFRRPDIGLARLFTQQTMGGIIARRHLTALILVPFLLTIAMDFQRLLGNHDRAVSLAVAMLLVLVGLVATNWFTAKELDRLDKQKQLHEQKLKEQEQLLSGVLDAVPLGIWIADRSGRIIRTNPAGINIWRGERYVGMDNYDQYLGWWAHNGKQISCEEWALSRAMNKGETSVDETINIQCFDGSRKVILNSAMPLRNENGQITGSIATNYDISRRYRLEKNMALVAHAGEELIALKDLEFALKQVTALLIKDLCDCSLIYMVDEDGAPKLVSQAYRDTPFAKRFESLAHRYPLNPVSKMGVLGALEKRRSILVRDINEGVVQSIAQDSHHAAELREILHSYMLIPMVAENKAVGILSLLNCDPTRRYDDIDLLAAEELGRLAALAIENARYSEKLKKAIQAREDVVAIVSHDLRNPLAVIFQSCELIGKELKRQHASDSIMRLVSLAKSAGRRMQEMISDLLDLSHLESGQLVLKYEVIDCSSFLRETVDLLVPLASEKGLSLNLDLPAGLPPAHADRIRLAQILNNLIGNAIKHTGSGGSIGVHARLREDGWLDFSVTDTGCGIRSEHLPSLFERYWKPTESKGGFGLGLFIVKGMIEAHGGTIHVTSEESKGSCFSFTIPSTLVALTQKAEAPMKPAAHPN